MAPSPFPKLSRLSERPWSRSYFRCVRIDAERDLRPILIPLKPSRTGRVYRLGLLDRIERELDELMQSTASGGEIVWTLRQTVFSAA